MPPTASRKRPGEPPEIEKLYAVLAVDAQGNEGIFAPVIPGLGAMPAVFSTGGEKLETIAANIAKFAREAGEAVVLVEFTRTQVIKRLT